MTYYHAYLGQIRGSLRRCISLAAEQKPWHCARLSHANAVYSPSLGGMPTNARQKRFCTMPLCLFLHKSRPKWSAGELLQDLCFNAMSGKDLIKSDVLLTIGQTQSNDSLAARRWWSDSHSCELWGIHTYI